MVNGVDTNFNNQYLNYAYQPYNIENLGEQNNQSISFSGAQKFGPAQGVELGKQEQQDNVKDGKDDGHIGFWRATGHFIKGIGKFFLSGFTDENGNFSLGRTLLTVGMAALCVVTWGTAIPAALAIVGAAAGAKGMATSIYNICTAESDAEDEAAWESLGSSTTQVALSTKALCKMTGNPTTINGIKNSYKTAGKEIWNSGRNYYNGASNAVGEASGFKGKFGALREYNAQKYSNFKTTVANNYKAIKMSNTTSEADAAAARNAQNNVTETAVSTERAGMMKRLSYKAKNYKNEFKYGTKALSKQAWKLKNEGTLYSIASNSGRAEQTTPEAKLMEMLSPDERKYFYTLPKEQREQILDQIAYAA